MEFVGNEFIDRVLISNLKGKIVENFKSWIIIIVFKFIECVCWVKVGIFLKVI